VDEKETFREEIGLSNTKKKTAKDCVPSEGATYSSKKKVHEIVAERRSPLQSKGQPPVSTESGGGDQKNL